MSILDKIKKEEGFLVPPHYFDRLPDAVFARIKKEEAIKRKRVFLAIGSIAASFLLLLGIVGFIRMEDHNKMQWASHRVAANENLPAVDTAELRNYLAMNETHSEIADQLEASFMGKVSVPVYASESELASVANHLDEGDYLIVEYYAEEIESESSF
ncbi:MAG: hypothetical protein LBL18_04455 [Bacteroidales bacterium]|jgi:hypothetical protein|nr:hypothetical protein [Bacteroidales bacterium]